MRVTITVFYLIVWGIGRNHINHPVPKGTVVKVSEKIEGAIPKEGACARVISFDLVHHTCSLKLSVGGTLFKFVDLSCITFSKNKDTMNVFKFTDAAQIISCPSTDMDKKKSNNITEDKAQPKKFFVVAVKENMHLSAFLFLKMNKAVSGEHTFFGIRSGYVLLGLEKKLVFSMRF